MPTGLRLVMVHCSGPELGVSQQKVGGVLYATEFGSYSVATLGLKIPRNYTIQRNGDNNDRLHIKVMRNDRDVSLRCLGSDIDALANKLVTLGTPRERAEAFKDLLNYVRKHFSAVPAAR